MIENAVALIPAPEPFTTVNTAPAPVDRGWLGDIAAWADTVPGWSWALALAMLTVFTLISLPWARSQAYKAGQRAGGKRAGDRKGTALFVAAMVPAAFFWLAVLAGSFRGLAGFGKDTLKWVDGWEYLVPLTLDGIAISFGFLAFRAVRASRSPERAVRVATGAAAASALINYGHEVSIGGSMLGGGYLGLLSVLGMLIFHEFLDQFTEGTAYIQRVNPKFGLRWLTWPTNTVCAWIAWRNYPPTPLPAKPTDGQKVWWGSINHAVAHLATVRRAKRIAQYATDVQTRRTAAPWWLVKVPSVRKLTATLTAQQAEMAEMSARLDRVAADFAAEKLRADEATRRAETEAENARRALAEKTTAEDNAAQAYRLAEKTRTDAETEMNRLRAEITATVHRIEIAADRRVTAMQTERDQALARLDQAEQRWITAKQEAAILGRKLSDAMAETDAVRLSADRAERDAAALRSALTAATERHTAEMAETATRLRAEMAENEARIRAEKTTVHLPEYRGGERSKPRSAARSTTAERRNGAPNAPRMNDETALQALLRAHPEPEWEWSQPQIRDITGAGGERLGRLQRAIADHHRRVAEKAAAGSAGEAEKSSGEDTGDVAATTGEDTEIARPVAHAG